MKEPLTEFSTADLRAELSKRSKEAHRARLLKLKQEREEKKREQEDLESKVFVLRETGSLFSEIEEELGLRKGRASSLYRRCYGRQHRKLEAARRRAKLVEEYGDQAILHIDVSDLPLSTRTINALNHRLASKATVENVLKLSDAELRRLRNFGPSCMRELDYWLEQHGLVREKSRDNERAY